MYLQVLITNKTSNFKKSQTSKIFTYLNYSDFRYFEISENLRPIELK